MFPYGLSNRSLSIGDLVIVFVRGLLSVVVWISEHGICLASLGVASQAPDDRRDEGGGAELWFHRQMDPNRKDLFRPLTRRRVLVRSEECRPVFDAEK